MRAIIAAALFALVSAPSPASAACTTICFPNGLCQQRCEPNRICPGGSICKREARQVCQSVCHMFNGRQICEQRCQNVGWPEDIEG